VPSLAAFFTQVEPAQRSASAGSAISGRKPSAMTGLMSSTGSPAPVTS